jgi:hypothetical protein
VPEWDKDSPLLRQNLEQVLKEIVLAAERREIPTLEAARHQYRCASQRVDRIHSRRAAACELRARPGSLDRIRNSRRGAMSVQGAVYLRKTALEDVNSPYSNS